MESVDTMVTEKRTMRMKKTQGICRMPSHWLLSRRLILTLFMVLLLAGTVFAAGGDYVWPPYNVPMAGNQEARASMADSQGNLVLVGSTDSNGTDMYIVKVKEDGSGILWSVTKGGPGADVATAVTIDSNNDVIVTGYIWDGPDYTDIYTAKYAGADGTLLWEHTYDGSGSGYDYPTAITVDNVGNVFVTGYVQDLTTQDNMILLKYHPTNGPNQDGTPLWAITYDAGNNGHDRAYAIVADDIHGVAITGESQNTTPDFDCLTVKYDTAGNQLWVRRYADTGDGRGEALAMDKDGNVVMAGYISNGTDQDFYVIEYAADDSPANWVNIYDSGYDDHATALWLDGDDNVYVAGDDATLTTGSDIHVAKYDGVSGVEAWNTSYKSFNGYNDMGLDLAGDPNGELYVVGYKNDGIGGPDSVLALKVKKDDGTQLWFKEYDGVGLSDRSLCACLASDGNLLVGGWSDRGTPGNNDYDFLALKFESGAINEPTGLTATVVSNTRIDLVWGDNSAAEDNFILERKIGELGSYSVIATLAPDVISYNDTGLTPDTRYYYRVKAYSAVTGSSPYSNEENAKTTIVSYDPPSVHFEYGGAGGGDDFAEAITVGADNHPVVTGFITGTDTSFDYYTIKLDRTDLSEQWSASYNDGDNEVDVATAITVDSQNRVVVSGFSSLYGGGAGNTNDIYTIGYPADGSTEAWADQYNGPDGNDDRSTAVASAVDGSDSTVVIGYGKNAAFNDDIYVIKYLVDGTRAWAITPYDSGGNDYPAAVAFDSNGDVLVGGYTSNGSNKDFLVAKYRGTDGSQIWQQSFNGAANGDDAINALVVDASGNLYVTGSSSNASGNSDIYTIKFAATDGALVWEKGFNGLGNGYDIGEGITFDPVDGDIMVGGTTFVSSGNHDYQLIRYATADGTLIWQKTLDRPGSNDALYAMSIDGSGTVALTGTTNSGVNDDVLTVKYDSDGIILSASVYNGPDDRDDAPSSITTNAYGETFVAGFAITADGDTDYMVFLSEAQTMQAPTPFTATQLYTEIDLSWADNSLNESGFELERKTGSCDSANPWVVLYLAAPDETGYMDTGLSIDSTFCYRIRSYNASGDTSRWAQLEVTTADPIAPTNLTATVLNTTEVQLDWTDNTGSEEGFTLERCEGVDCDFTTTTSLNVPANATSFIDDTVCPGQVYSYRLKAYKTNEWVTSASSVAADNMTYSTNAPTGLDTDWVSEQWVELKWLDNSSDETEFLIERCAGSGCSSFVPVATLASPEGNQLYYRMDEPAWNGTVGEVVDLSSAGNHGQSLGGTTTVTGSKYARAGSFDGVDDAITTPLLLDQSDSSAGATMAAWVYPGSNSANNHFIFDTDNGGNDWGLLRNAGTWYVANGDDAALVNTGVVADLNSWQHLAVVFNPASGVTLYKNGSAVWSNAAIGFDDSSAAFALGRRGSLNQEFFDGRLDEVAVFDRPLAMADIQVLYNHGLARYNDWSVTHSTIYNYQIRAAKNSSCNWASDPSSAIQLTTTPLVPTNLTATVVDSGHIQITWADNTTTETGFRIERCEGSGCSAFSEIAMVGVNVTSYVDPAVCADPNLAMPYSYRVVAINGVVWSSVPSNSDEAVVPALVAPTNLSVASASEDTVNLEWDYLSGDLAGFRVSRCAGDATFCANSANFGADTDITMLPDSNLLMLSMNEASWNGTAGEVADVSGNGNNGTGYGGVTTTVNGKYGRAGWFDGVNDYIVTPLNIDQSSTSPGVTFEAWVYPTVNDSNYKYVISTDNGGADWSLYQLYSTWYIMNGNSYVSTGIPVTFNSWQHIVVTFHPATGVAVYKNGNENTWSSPTIYTDTSDGNVTIGRRGTYTTSSYYFLGGIDEVAVYDQVLSPAEILDRYQQHIHHSEAGLIPESPYYFRVKAYKNHDAPGCNWESNFDEVGSATQIPAAPNNLTVTAVDSTQIDLTWNDNSTSETAYRVQWCQGVACSFDADPNVNSVVLPADSVSYSDSTVCQGDTYRYQVRAEKDDGPVWQTAWLVGQTSTVVATPPGNFTATPLSESEIALEWDDLTIDEDQFVIERCQSAAFDCATPTPISNFLGTVVGKVLHYRMDEALWNSTVNEVTDEAGLGNHGRSYGIAVTVAEGKYNRGGYFDGSNDYVQTPLLIDQKINGPGATFEGWVKPTSTDTTYHTVFSTENGGYDWSLQHYNGIWYVYTGVNRLSTGVTVDLDAWQHIAVAFSPGGAAIRFYKNGVETVLSAAYIDYDNSVNPLFLGRVANSSYYYQGYMDEVAVYNRPLTQAEVIQHYQSQIDLYALTDTGLNPGLPYTYRIKATKSASCSWETTAMFFTATTDNPPEPSDLAISATDTTTFDLSWTDNSGSETSYNLERCVGFGTACDEDAEFSTLDAALLPDTAGYTDSTVCEGTIYSYRLRAEKDDGPIWQTTWAGPVAQTTTAKIAPSGLVVNQVSEVQIDLAWSDSNNDETGFKVERCAGVGCSSFAEIARVEAGATSYQDDQLDPDTSYSYQVKAYKTADCAWETGYSNISTAATDITAPSGLVANTVDTTQIDLDWTDNAATETATVIERCSGSGCSDFVALAEVGPNMTSYSDPDACYGTTYNYRVLAKDEGLSSNNGGCWTRRVPLTFSAFVAGANAEIAVSYDADMRPDFGDVRFYDEDGMRELAYGILNKTDGVSATFLVKLGKNTNINIYYGNAAATYSGTLDYFIEFQDTFSGTSINSSKWLEIDPDHSIEQNNDLLLIDVSDIWSKALISQQTFTREAGKELYIDLTVPADTLGNNHIMIGWELNQTSNPSYNQLVHGLYWNNYLFSTYEKGLNTGGSGNYAASIDYKMKIVLKDAGAKYYVMGGAYATWTLIQETTTNSDTPLRIAFTQHSHQMNIHQVKVGEASIAAGVSFGAEESSACYSYGNTWESGYSNEAEATTTSPVAPSGLLAIAITDTQVDLSWTDNTDAESGFKIERCSGSGCSNFIQIDTVPGNVTSYADTTAPASIESSYRVRAFKSSSSSWDSGYSNTASDLTFPAASGNLTATALNSRMIKLEWDDNATDEDGYEVEVLVASGQFVKIADLPASSVSFVDTMAVDAGTEYKYRVRPYRGGDVSPYSNIASETTYPYLQGDGTCWP